MLELTYKLFNFNEEDKSTHKKVIRESFEKLLNSQSFKQKLKNRFLVGAISHEIRDRFNDPDYRTPSVNSHFDYLAKEHRIANVMTDIWINDADDVLVKLLVPDFDDGIDVQRLFGIGSNLGISMSIYTDPDTSRGFRIIDFAGCDFTSDPRMDTPLLDKKVVKK